MNSRHLSLRIEESLGERLGVEARREKQTVSELARELIEEGLRMRNHPGIVFRPGPAGRRAALLRGPDVWQVIMGYNDSKEAGDDPVKYVCEVADLHPFEVDEALKYYAEFPDEIDEWIREEIEEEEQGYAAWLREQQVATS
jgi:hypothetical protein